MKIFLFILFPFLLANPGFAQKKSSNNALTQKRETPKSMGYKFHEQTQGISDIDEYMILSMELPPERESIAKTIFPDVFMVDWVKVYKKQMH